MSDATRTFSFGFSGEPQLLDTTALAVRIAASYRVAAAEFAGHGDSMWAAFSVQQAPVIEAIRNNDIVSLGRLLADPSSNDFLWGYDDLLKTFTEIRMQHPDQAENGARPIYDALVQVAIGVGAIPCPYPEGGQGNPEPPIEVLLRTIDAVFGFKVDFPNPFKMNFGLETSRGIASVRCRPSTRLGALTGYSDTLAVREFWRSGRAWAEMLITPASLESRTTRLSTFRQRRLLRDIS